VRRQRPRDETGRPLPYDAVGVEPVPDLQRSPGEALALAQRLLDEGRAFAAHEVLEGAWKAAPAVERDLWQGLAQLAVAITHAQRGNRQGATALLRRAAGRLSSYTGESPHGIRAAELAAAAEQAATALDGGGDLQHAAALRPTLSGAQRTVN
jgi:hypothetical protein